MADNSKKYFDIQADVFDKSPDTHLAYVIGQRGVGKTYSVKTMCIRNFIENGKKFCLCRRWTTEITSRNLTFFMSDVDMSQFDFSKFDPNAEYVNFHIMAKSSIFYLVGEKQNGSLVWIAECGLAVCLSMAETVKGMALNDVSILFFDEFVSERRYMENEIDLWSKIINTIGRSNNKDLRIIMAANPDASPEATPYLAPVFKKLRVSYNKLDPNTIYYFDSTEGRGSKKVVLKNNIAFIKLANYEGDFLNVATSSLFDSSEEEMSKTGAVKTSKYIHMESYAEFKPSYCLEVETPIWTETEWHKRVYAYFGEWFGEPVCVVLGHNKFKDLPTLYCRYDETDFRPRKLRQTFRIRIPNEEGFSPIKKYLSAVDTNRFIITDDDENATLFEQVRLNS